MILSTFICHGVYFDMKWMILPDTRLLVRWKKIIFVHIFMNRKYSSNNDISWGCSFHHSGILVSGMSYFQSNKEKYDLNRDSKSKPGHISVLCLLCELSFPLSALSLASFCFFTSGRVILSFLSIFSRLKENNLLLPHSHFTILTFSPAALPPQWLTTGESLVCISRFGHIRCYAKKMYSPKQHLKISCCTENKMDQRMMTQKNSHIREDSTSERLKLLIHHQNYYWLWWNR